MNTLKKSPWKIYILYLLMFLIIVQGISWWKSRQTLRGNLTEFSGELMNGERFAIADFSGRPVLLHFWATWCPICDLGMSNIESISSDYPVISIASWSEGQANVTAYTLDNQLTFPVLLDDDGSLARSFGLKGVPASFILNPDGEVSFVETGYTTEIGLRIRLWLTDISY